MNMTAPMSAMDVIVGRAVLFAVIFFAAWLGSPRLRAWVERPKYRFQADLRAYDQAQSGKSTLNRRNTRT